MTQQIQQSSLQEFTGQLIDSKNEFQAVLPINCTFERFARIVKTAIIQVPELLDADRKSLFTACLKSAKDGLLPDGRESALVPYKTKQKDGTYKALVQYMPMIGGILKKVRNSGELASLYAHIVYSNDEFGYSLGDNEQIIHKPAMGDRGRVLYAYAIAKTKDNFIYREIMSFDEIEKIRNISKSKDGTAWKEHWDEMAKKTVIRRISKRLPMSTDLEQVIQRDDEMFNYNQNYNNHAKNFTAPPVSAIENINRQVIDIKSTTNIGNANNSSTDNVEINTNKEIN